MRRKSLESWFSMLRVNASTYLKSGMREMISRFNELTRLGKSTTTHTGVALGCDLRLFFPTHRSRTILSTNQTVHLTIDQLCDIPRSLRTSKTITNYLDMDLSPPLAHIVVVDSNMELLCSVRHGWKSGFTQFRNACRRRAATRLLIDSRAITYVLEDQSVFPLP